MRVLAAVLLTLSSAFAYQVTFPGGSSGWNTTGPNYLEWERVSTDPLNFTAILTNVDTNTNQLLANTVDGTLGIALCPPPAGGWPTGSAFRVNLAQDASHLDTLLAQSSEFNITAASSGSSTTSSGAQTGSSATATATSPVTSGSTTTSSQTGTTPTGTNAASLSADSRVGVLTAVGAATVLLTIFY
ncbi:GPI-anchored small secreted protein [Chiua virens]|nr:GPI-anchored small secreted protein [Chiua virens]